MAIRYLGNNAAKPKKAEPVAAKATITKPAIVKPVVDKRPVVKAAEPEKQSSGRRGRPKSAKIRTNILLDPAVIEHYKAGGPGWQSRINADLLEIAQKK